MTQSSLLQGEEEKMRKENKVSEESVRYKVAVILFLLFLLKNNILHVSLSVNCVRVYCEKL